MHDSATEDEEDPDKYRELVCLKYKTTPVEERGVVVIEVFTPGGNTLCTLESSNGSMSTVEEQIQNWLDTNGYDYHVYEFEKINTLPSYLR